MSDLSIRRHPLLTAIAVAAVVIGIGVYWFGLRGSNSASAARAPGLPTVPVQIATAATRNVPIYAIGLGTVQASLTVAIHSQVDGKLQEVLFTEGQHVKKGDILAKIDPQLYQAALDQAVAKKAQDDAQLIAAQKDLARFQAVAAKGFETQQNLDLQQAKVDQFKAAVAADAAAIEAAQTQVNYTLIRAPSDGRMGVRLIDPGNIVHASDQASLVTLTLTQPSAVLFTLPARSLEDVREAMSHGDVEVVAYDQDNRRALSAGKLLLIDNVIDQATATIKLKAMFENKDERLWPGEFINARMKLRTEQNAVVVPPAAVQRGPNGLYVWLVKQDNSVEIKPVKTGATSGNVTIVTSGLATGDRVVIDGQYKLQANSPVVINAAAAKANEEAADEPL